jgi:hypothetical protein
MKAMDIVTIGISAEIVGKIYVLACCTEAQPTNDLCECMAVNLLEKALDAALEVYGSGYEDQADLSKNTVKLALVNPLPEMETKGMVPLFLPERTVRYLRQACGIAGEDGDSYVAEIVGRMVQEGLDEPHDVGFAGLSWDLVENHGPGGRSRTEKEKSALIGKLKKLSCDFQSETTAKGVATPVESEVA